MVTSAGCRWPRRRRSACSTPSAAAWILIETVGVGQVEVEVAGKADTTVVVVNPGWGDSVQANKAGLMEVADVFVINKADRAGADETRRDLEQMLDLAGLPTGRAPRLAPADRLHRGHHRRRGRRAVGCRRRAPPARGQSRGSSNGAALARSREELARDRRPAAAERAGELCGEERWGELTDAVLARELDPWAAADEMIGPVLSPP